MKNLFIFFIFFILISNSAAEQIKIKVTEPVEGAIISEGNAFIFGQVIPAKSELFINGIKASVYKNGAFIAYVPVSSENSEFVFQCKAIYNKEEVICERNVSIRNKELKDYFSNNHHFKYNSKRFDLVFKNGEFCFDKKVFEEIDLTRHDAFSVLIKDDGEDIKSVGLEIVEKNGNVLYQIPMFSKKLNDQTCFVSNTFYPGMKDVFADCKIKFKIRDKNDIDKTKIIDDIIISCNPAYKEENIFINNENIPAIIISKTGNKFTANSKKIFYAGEGSIFKLVINSDAEFTANLINENKKIIYENIPMIKSYKNSSSIGFIFFKPEDNFRKANILIRTKKNSDFIEDISLIKKEKPESKNKIPVEYIIPEKNTVLVSEDILQLEIKTISSCTVFFSIKDESENFIYKTLPMKEKISDSGKSMGIYESSFKINTNDDFQNAKVVYLIVDKSGNEFEFTANGSLSIEKSPVPQVVELPEEDNIVYNNIYGTYYLFLPKKVRSIVNGRIGGKVRLQISKYHEAWINERKVKFLPLGTPSQEASIPAVFHKKENNKSIIELKISEKRPYKVDINPELKQIKLHVFGAISLTDWIVFDENDKKISSINWSQIDPDVYELTIQLKDQDLWGYDIFYKKNEEKKWKDNEPETLILELNHKKKKNLTLRDLKICLDPGHSPASGAVGPTEYQEKEANLKIADELEILLEKSGAKVIMTRNDNRNGFSLDDRKKFALDNNCDIFLSIHNNALPEGVNPFENHGTSALFYHPQDKLFSEILLKHLKEETGLQSFGLFYGNISVLRLHQIPAALVECAFISYPEEEYMLKNEYYQKKMAKALYLGILDFINIK